MEIEERARYVGGDLLPEIVLAHLRLLDHRVLLGGPAFAPEPVEQGNGDANRDLSGAVHLVERDPVDPEVTFESQAREQLAVDRRLGYARRVTAGLLGLELGSRGERLRHGRVLISRNGRRTEGRTEGI